MGLQDPRVGVSSEMGPSQGSSLGFPHLFIPSFQHGQQGGLSSRSDVPLSQGGNRGDLSPLVSGFLRPPFLCEESIRRLASHSRSEYIEPVSRKGQVQDGDPCFYSRSYQTGKLGSQHRPNRCLLPHPDFPRGQEVPQVHLGGQSFRFQSPALRPVSGSLAVHEGSTQVYSASQGVRDSHPCVSGRLVGLGQSEGSMCVLCHSGSRTGTLSGFQGERNEIGIDPLPILCLSRDEVRHGEHAGLPTRGADSQTFGDHAHSFQEGISLSESSSWSLRPNGEPLPPSGARQTPQEGFSTRLPRSLVSSDSVLRRINPSGSMVLNVSPAVVKHHQSVGASGGPIFSVGHTWC